MNMAGIMISDMVYLSKPEMKGQYGTKWKNFISWDRS